MKPKHPQPPLSPALVVKYAEILASIKEIGVREVVPPPEFRPLSMAEFKEDLLIPRMAASISHHLCPTLLECAKFTPGQTPGTSICTAELGILPRDQLTVLHQIKNTLIATIGTGDDHA